MKKLFVKIAILFFIFSTFAYSVSEPTVEVVISNDIIKIEIITYPGKENKLGHLYINLSPLLVIDITFEIDPDGNIIWAIKPKEDRRPNYAYMDNTAKEIVNNYLSSAQNKSKPNSTSNHQKVMIADIYGNILETNVNMSKTNLEKYKGKPILIVNDNNGFLEVKKIIK